MKVLYLFTNSRKEMARRVRNGTEHDNHFFGMFRLPKYGIDTDYVELELVYSAPVARFLRRHLSIHFFHLPVFFRIIKYDVVLTSAALGTLLLSRLLCVGPKKWIMYDYNISGQVTRTQGWRGRLFRYLMRRVDGFIMLGGKEVEVMRKLFPRVADTMAFIPFGCDTEHFAPRADVKEVRNLVLSVGRDPGRDWGTFLKAIAGLPIRVETTAKLSALASAATAIPNHVSVYDWTPDELMNGYARASVVVLPLAPRYENDTMGLSTLVEAMSMGKAIVATDTSVIRDYVVDGESAILVPQGNPKLLRDAIETLLSDPDKRRALGKAAREQVHSLCDAEKVTKQLANYLIRVVGGGIKGDTT